MSDLAIRVENLSKRYKIGVKQERYKTLRDTLAQAFTAPFRRLHNNSPLKKGARGMSRLNSEIANPSPSTLNSQLSSLPNSQSEIRNSNSNFIWAIKDVSFEIKRGEVVGIIGSNGAGKSTLLKILCRITEPTKGYAEVLGRVGSLLEVGTGFHPELTGRENIFLNGAILGMKKAEIESKFDAIVAFAEVEKFIDTPVKHYSSGMYLRLAFAVAAHLDPEILLVDEVLAVGDIAFQKKCLGKMGDVARAGRTVLFVSHNLAAVTRLCPKAILLEHGSIAISGTSSEVVSSYLRSGLANLPSGPRLQEQRDGKSFWLTDVAVLDRHKKPAQAVRSGEDLMVTLYYDTVYQSNLSGIIVNLAFYDATGTPLFDCRSLRTLSGPITIPARGSLQCIIPNLPLIPSEYTIEFWCKIDKVIVAKYENLLKLSVVEGDFFGTGSRLDRRSGPFLVSHSWNVIHAHQCVNG